MDYDEPNHVYEYNVCSGYIGIPHCEVTYAALWGGVRENTSAHGIPHVDNAKGGFKKGFWAFVGLSMFGAFLFNFSIITRDYFSYKTDVILQFHRRNQMQFPAVTVCNMNPFKASALGALSKRKKRGIRNADENKETMLQMEQMSHENSSVTSHNENKTLHRTSLENEVNSIIQTKLNNTTRKAQLDQMIKNINHRQHSQNSSRLLTLATTKGVNQVDRKVHLPRSHPWDIKPIDEDLYLEVKALEENRDKTSYGPKVHAMQHDDQTISFKDQAISPEDFAILPHFKFGSLNTGGSNYVGHGGKGRRHKRQIDIENCDLTSSAFHEESGLCFGVGHNKEEKFDGGKGALEKCSKESAKPAFLNTPATQTFVQQTTAIFSGAGVSAYWINIRNKEWANKVGVDYTNDYTNFASGEENQGDCVKAVVSNNHKWYYADCNDNSDKHYILCQKLVGCPNPVYTDGSNTYCYFAISPTTASVYSRAEELCSEYDVNAKLAVVDTAEKQAYLKSLDPFAAATTFQRFWIRLAYDTGNYKWGDNTAYSYNNFAPSSQGTNCGSVDIDSFLWYDADCSQDYLILCQTEGVQYHGTATLAPDIPTTETPTTSQPPATTTAPLTTTVLEITTTDLPTTTVGLTTTILDTTTNILTSTLRETTSTTEFITTTNVETTTKDTTTIDLTTTVIDTTTKSLSTTLKEATTIAPTTLHETTTLEDTTTEQDTTTVGLTTTQLDTTSPDTTTVDLTTTVPKTTSEQLTTSLPDTTTLTFTTPIESTTIATTTTTKRPSTSPVYEVPTPAPLVGSSFPERVAAREDFTKQETITESVADLPEEEKASLGYQTTEFLLDCMYDGNTCDINTNFKYFFNSVHGNCYVFNSGWNSTDLYTSHKTGRRHGLQLVINIGQDEYSKDTGDSAGARVVVHSHKRMPFPEDEGVLAKPGRLTSVGVTLVRLERSEHPFGNCTRYKPGQEKNLTRNIFEEEYPDTTYSLNGCYKTCYQSYVIKECGCADAYYPKYGAAFGYRNITSCSVTNITQDDCKYGVTRRFINNELECHCPVTCDDDMYLPTTTFLQWPSDITKNKTLESLRPLIPGILDVPEDPKKYQRNLLKIEVYFEEFRFEFIKERPKYTDSSYVGDIGGILGLWLGFSVLTILEFMEFIIDSSVFTIQRIRLKHSPGLSEMVIDLHNAGNRGHNKPSTKIVHRRQRARLLARKKKKQAQQNSAHMNNTDSSDQDTMTTTLNNNTNNSNRPPLHTQLTSFMNSHHHHHHHHHHRASPPPAYHIQRRASLGGSQSERSLTPVEGTTKTVDHEDLIFI